MEVRYRGCSVIISTLVKYKPRMMECMELIKRPTNNVRREGKKQPRQIVNIVECFSWRLTVNVKLNLFSFNYFMHVL